ncbi:hypothetical protein BKA70DRAFT_1291014, partial [Coprinopsis sp. MPI-PUGE-AT-0042]
RSFTHFHRCTGITRVHAYSTCRHTQTTSCLRLVEVEALVGVDGINRLEDDLAVRSRLPSKTRSDDLISGTSPASRLAHGFDSLAGRDAGNRSIGIVGPVLVTKSESPVVVSLENPALVVGEAGINEFQLLVGGIGCKANHLLSGSRLDRVGTTGDHC